MMNYAVPYKMFIMRDAFDETIADVKSSQGDYNKIYYFTPGEN